MTKITIVLVFVLSCVIQNTQAQAWQWATTSQSDEVFYTSSDTLGNVYQVGKFSGTANFSGQSLTSGPGFYNWFLAKYNSSGTIQWVKKAMSGNGDREIIALTTDVSGNVFIGGYFSDTTIVSGTTILSHGDRDAFVAKYNQAGTLLWVKSGGGNYDDEFDNLVCDAAGNIYAVGKFVETANFDGQIVPGILSNFSSDALLVCYNSSGAISYAKGFGGNQTETAEGVALYNNKLYMSGHFRSLNSVFQTDTIHWSGTGGAYDVYLAELSLTGDIQWVNGFNNKISSLLFRIGTSVAANSSGVYVAGPFSTSVNFGSGALTSTSTAQNSYIAKFDFSGNVQWANALIGQKYISAKKVITTINHVYLAGNFTDTLKMLGQNYIGRFGVNTIGENNGFVSSWNSDGTLGWIKTVLPHQNGSIIGVLRIEGIAANNNNVFVSASFTDDIDLSPLNPTTDGVYNNIDGLLAKIDITTNGIEEISQSTLNCYPNPATNQITIETKMNENYVFSITNMNGQVILTQNSAGLTSAILDISQLSKGIYILEVHSKNNIESKKLVIQ